MSKFFEAKLLSLPLRSVFTIARGGKTSCQLIRVVVRDGRHGGVGEGVIYPRYGQEGAGSHRALMAVQGPFEQGLVDQHNWQDFIGDGMPLRAARHALSTALLMLGWQMNGDGDGSAGNAMPNAMPSAQHQQGLAGPLMTLYTLSLDGPTEMAAAAQANRARPYLKLKLAGDDVAADLARVRAVVAAAPRARLVLDANEAWDEDFYRAMLASLAEDGAARRVVAIEQPFAAGADDILTRLQMGESTIPICADESFHDSGDIKKMLGRYQMINIKMDKCGGYQEAEKCLRLARHHGLRVMWGCMVGSSLSLIAPYILANRAGAGISPPGHQPAGDEAHDLIDLDGASFIKDESNSWDALFIYDADSTMRPNDGMKKLLPHII